MDDDEQPVDIDELLPIRVSGYIEPESDDLGAVAVVTTRRGVVTEQADPESSMSDATSSPPESDYEDEAESESSERDRGEFGSFDPPRESTSVPVPGHGTYGGCTVRPGYHCQGRSRRNGPRA